MKKGLKDIGLKKIFFIIMTSVFVLLLIISILGIKQYFLYQHCEQIVLRSNKLLFGFTSIKEHISDTLLSGKKLDITAVNRELQGFDKDLKVIVDDLLVPEELKLTFISQVDLLDLVVQLRGVHDEGGLESKSVTRLSASLRSIHNRLHKFDVLLGAYTRSLLFGLHRVIIGTLALVLFIVIIMLLVINRYISRPINRLCREVVQTDDDGQGSEEAPYSITQSIQALDQQVRHNRGCQSRLANLQACFDNMLQTVPDNLVEPDDWETLCLALQTNPDYFLVWAGRQTGKNAEGELEIIGCGCEACSSSQCRETVDHLFKFCRQDDGLCQSARQAIHTGVWVTNSVSARGVPETLRSAMVDEGGSVATASFPIARADQPTVIITIYSRVPDCFSRIETGILHFALQQLGKKSESRGNEVTKIDASLAGLYQFSVIGALADNLANEITNIANGALNYSQALLDLAEEQPGNEEQKKLLVRLQNEEHKVARLASGMHRLTMQLDQRQQKITVAGLLDEILQVLQGLHNREHIAVNRETEKDIPDLYIAKGIIQAVLLTLLQQARMYLVQSVHLSGNERIITLKTWFDAEQKNVSVQISPCPSDDEEFVPTIPRPWPSRETCARLLKQVRGELVISGSSQKKSYCTLLLPVD